MNTVRHIQNSLDNGAKDELLQTLYDPADLHAQKQRLRGLLDKVPVRSENEIYIFSVPGRTELGGNHTDHNHGKVLAAAVHLDAIAIVVKTPANCVELNSIGVQADIKVHLDNLKPRPNEKNTVESLIRGTAAQLHKRGYAIGGFRGIISSSIPMGSGLSSSAAVEVLIGSIFNHLYNKARITALEIASAAQYAENHYFGKPCGLMDQLACALGGIVTIDFADPAKPQYTSINAQFKEHGYTLCVVNTGSSHEDLTEEYTSIQQEMKAVARVLQKSYCREITESELRNALPELRKAVNDRAILRALHFFEENRRVDDQVRLLTEKKIEEYLEVVNTSGRSSWMLLQNCYAPSRPQEQPLCLALALTSYFSVRRTPCRVHGGGFAGTIQTYIPNKDLEKYRLYMEKVFGKGCVIPLHIRNKGAARIH
jgi:galactokinase